MRFLTYLVTLHLMACQCALGADKQGWDTKAYMESVNAVLQNAWHPDTSQPVGYKTVVRFNVKSDGVSDDIIVVRSSGDSALDASATAAVSAAKFSHLPPGAPKSVVIEFTFAYKKTTSKSNVEARPAAQSKLKAPGSTGSTAASTVASTAAGTGSTISENSDAANKVDGTIEQSGFRYLHSGLRVLAPVVATFLLFIQALMFVVYLCWLGWTHLQLRLDSRRELSGKDSSGK